MRKNFILSFIILGFSLFAFLLFSLETYFLSDKLNGFWFLFIAFIYIFLFALLISLIINKLFGNEAIIKEISKAFLIIMVAMLIFNLIELFFVKNTSFLSNSLLYFIVMIFQTLRVICGFAIPLYVLVILLNVCNTLIFRGKNESIRN